MLITFHGQQLVEGLPEPTEETTEDQTDALAPSLSIPKSAYFSFQHLRQPFRGVQGFDIERLMNIAKTRQDLTDDHLWLLQTEPSYMRWYVKEIGKEEHIKYSGRSNGFSWITLILEHEVESHWIWRMICKDP
jgi:hypothetical protein